MYNLSISNFEKDYELQVKSKDFRLAIKEVEEAEILNIIKTNIHSWRIFKDGKRGGSNVQYITAIILDFDKNSKIEDFKSNKFFKKYNYLLYSSRNHKVDKFDGSGRQERFHVAFPFSKPMDDFNAYIGLQEGILDITISEGLNPDLQVKDLSRVFFPSRPNRMEKPLSSFEYHINNGIDILKDIATLTKTVNRSQNTDVKKLVTDSDSDKLALACKFLQEYNANNGLEYSQWVRIGASLHDTPQGESLFFAISKEYKGGIADNSQITAKWNATGLMTSIGLGSLYHLAYNLGWDYKPTSVNREMSLLVADKVKELEEDFNRSLNADLCKLVLAGSKFKLVVAGERANGYNLTTSDIPQDALYLGVSKDDKGKFKRELLKAFITNGYLAREPYPYVIAGLQKGSSRDEHNCKEFLKLKKHQVDSFDNLTGRLKVIQNVQGDSFNNFSDAKLIEDVLDRIFNHRDFNYVPIINKFLAQLVFEHRTTAKATLVLMGARGTGKSFFINYIAGAFYNNSVSHYFGGDFSDWKEATKIISVEESSEHKADLKKLYNDIKDYSGSEQTLVNKKNIIPYMSPATAYFIVAMNDQFGFHIGDKGEDNQQFIVVNFPQEQVITDKDRWHQLGVDTDRIRNGLKTYALNTLLPIYLEMLRFESGFRYGFNTKANVESYRRLIDNSSSYADEGANDFLEQLADYTQGIGIDIASYNTGEMEGQIKLIIEVFKNTDFIPNMLITAILKQKRIKIKKVRLYEFFTKNGFTVKETVKKISGKSFRGIKVNGLYKYVVEDMFQDEMISLEENDIPF